MWSCTDVTNFIWIGRSATVLWHHIEYSRLWPYQCKSAFTFQFYVSHLGRQRTIWFCISNFEQTSQSMAKILLLLVAENKHLSYWNSTPGFDFDLFTVNGMWFCTDLPNFTRIRRSMTEYDVILIFQDGGHTVANLLPFLGHGYISHTFLKVQSYLGTKCRPDISIHGWDITTSVS